MQDQVFPQNQDPDREVDPSVQKSRAAWNRLLVRIKRITPKMLARAVLVLALLALLVWLVAQAWVSLVPFLFGGAIAYALLPLVNRLDKFMPRLVAVLFALAPVVALGVLFVWLLIPIVIRQFTLLTENLPAQADLEFYAAQVRAYIDTLPPNAQAFIYNLATRLYSTLEARGADLAAEAVNVTVSGTVGLLGALGFLLSFVIVPAWVLTVLTEQKNAAQATRRLLPEWMREDAWAVLRIFDRSLGWFLRGQVVLGVAAAFLVYIGLEILVRAMGRPGNVNYQLLLALFAGLMQLIPYIGPILGAIPGVLLGFSLSPELGVGALVVYFVVQQILENLVSPHLQGRIAGINRNLLILIIIAMSQLGFWWFLLAAPIAGIVYDLFRYAYGRFGDPPRPAGIIPSDAAWRRWNLPRAAVPTNRALRSLRPTRPLRSGKE